MNKEGKKLKAHKRPKISMESSCMLRTLHQVGNIPISNIIKNKHKYPEFAKFSPATLYRHAKRPLDGHREHDKRHNNKGRPRKLTGKDLRQIKRQIVLLRKRNGTFTSNTLQEEAGATHISNSVFRRYLRRLGYGYRRTRKKGLLTAKDKKLRLRFARKVKRNFKYNDRGSHILWTRGISMYVDAVGFEYKCNPYLHAKQPRAREWRLKNEGLSVTSKGKKEGMNQVKFLVGIGHNAGVILVEPITQTMNGQYYASIVRRCFPHALAQSKSPKAKRILVDGDPCQISHKAEKAISRIGAKYFRIPARSPDLNPIENLFHLIRNRLNKQAYRKVITSETKEQFTDRVASMLKDTRSNVIDNIIESMPKRIDMIIKRRGERIKY